MLISFLKLRTRAFIKTLAIKNSMKPLEKCFKEFPRRGAFVPMFFSRTIHGEALQGVRSKLCENGGLGKRLCHYFLAFYKLGFRLHLGGACKFHPTCSDYAQECFKKHSIPQATGLSILRLLRCHPFSKRSGWDPVPQRENQRSISGSGSEV